MQARYTVVLKDLMDNEQTSQKLSAALSTYPLYEQQSNVESIIPERSELNKRLLNAYKYREIGFETVGRFLDELQITMEEIMPYYNEMYKTIEIMAELDNPFDNVDFTETFRETTSGTSTTDTESNSETSSETSSNDSSNSTTDTAAQNSSNKSAESFSKKVHSSTPQNELSIPAENIDSVNYADDAEWNKAKGSEQESSSSDSTQETTTAGTTKTDASGTTKTDASGTQTTQETKEHTFSKKGNQGVNTYAHDMIEFRTSIIDVTNQIINDSRIKELFMMVF